MRFLIWIMLLGLIAPLHADKFHDSLFKLGWLVSVVCVGCHLYKKQSKPQFAQVSATSERRKVEIYRNGDGAYVNGSSKIVEKTEDIGPVDKLIVTHALRCVIKEGEQQLTIAADSNTLDHVKMFYNEHEKILHLFLEDGAYKNITVGCTLSLPVLPREVVAENAAHIVMKGQLPEEFTLAAHYGSSCTITETSPQPRSFEKIMITTADGRSDVSITSKHRHRVKEIQVNDNVKYSYHLHKFKWQV